MSKHSQSQRDLFLDRPDSESLVDLAVYIVPPELWRENLHSAVSDIDVISAGFLRVHPETVVTSLRDEIENQLSEEFEIPQAYVFLKNVGKCLTKVRHKQEITLKVKNFIPPGPSSFVPEIYLLEGGSDSMSIHPSSVSSSYRSEPPKEDPYQLNSYRGKRFNNQKPIPPIQSDDNRYQVTSEQPVTNDNSSRYKPPSPVRPDSSLRRQAEEEERRRRREEAERAERLRRELEERRKREEEERRRREEEERRRQREEEEKRRRDEEERRRREEEDRRLALEDEERRRLQEDERRRREEDERRRRLEEEERRRREEEEDERRRLEDERRREEEERKRREEEERRRLEEEEAERERREAELQKQNTEDGRNQKQTLIDELNRLREERRETERQREELVKRAKQLQSKTQNKRNQARDVWKKKYFEEKKKSPPLEDQCTKLRQELEALHKRIVNTMEGGTTNRGGKSHPLDKPSPQSNVKIQAARLQHEIEDLQRRVETIKMKLTAEMKLRNQAEVELRALRAELTQKKINVTLARSKQHQQENEMLTPRGQLAPLTSRS